MKKTEFRYERWGIRILSVCILVLLVACIDYWLEKFIEINTGGFLFALIRSIVYFAVLRLYSQYTVKNKIFTKKGYFVVEDGIVIIEKGKRKYKLSDVRFLFGTTMSVYSISRAGILKIGNGKKTITFILTSDKPIESFSESELLPLFETILEQNTGLKKDDELDFWYEIK